MHPRNRYLKNPADFGALAEFRPSLKPHLIEKRSQGEPPDPSKVQGFAYTLNFSDPAALRELTCAVLEKDFGLKLEIPLDRLIPTIPQKLNYIHWLEDLLSLGYPPGGVASQEEGVASETVIPKGRDIVGIDIGTGTSCIYPLLGSALNQWSFLATDIAMETVQCASGNVARNKLEDYIQVRLVSKDCMIKEALDPSVPRYAFSMCNPPFFESEQDKLGAASSRGSQRPLPHTFSSGSTEETVTEGGEVGFVSQMIKDSLDLRERVCWYTSMLGKRSSLKVLLSRLKNYQVPVVTSTEFVQGKTWRWGVAWSFNTDLKDRVEEKLSRRKRKKTNPLQLQVKGVSDSTPPPSQEGVKLVREWLEEMLGELEIANTTESCSEGESSCECGEGELLRCVAERVTWTHQRRRRRLLDRLKSYESDVKSESVSLDETQQKIKAKLDSLSVPCHIEFTAHITLKPANIASSPAKKRRKGSGKGSEESEDKGVWLELDWVQGDTDKDLLHQLLQFLHNKMYTRSFQ